MQVQEVEKKEQISTALRRRFDAMKALEEWKKQYGSTLKNWDFISVIRHWREQR
ncbi:MAG: hypothetical protein Q7S48_03615 [bacterium]|nr:hypothetical protein [bacterium]